MFLTVTPNLCIERTVVIENFAMEQVHRVPPGKLYVNAGGKGINAARVAARMGCEVLATAWVGQRQHEWFHAQLSHEGVPHDLVEVEPDTRICTNILDGAGSKTEIVEAGNPLHPDYATLMFQKLEELLPRASLVAICGSYPPQTLHTESFSTSLVNDANEANRPTMLDMHLTLLLRLAQSRGCRVIVDSKGRPFEEAVHSGHPPWCIKPNLDEAAQLLHRPIEGQAEEYRAVRELRHLGIEVVLLSCGERGAYLGTPQSIRFLAAPRVREVSPVGSGDALVGAFAAHYLRTNDLLEAARWGVAAGAANAAQLQSSFCNRADIEALLSQVQMMPGISLFP